jgi:TolB-like protein
MKFKSSHLAILAAIQVSACSSLFVSDNNVCFTDVGKAIDCSELSIGNISAPLVLDNDTAPQSNSFPSKINSQLLSEYIKQMVIDMQHSLNGATVSSSIAVTSFVTLNLPPNRPRILGHHISEYFTNELINIGLPASDYKSSGVIRVTTDGHFVLSGSEKQNNDINYVLTGSLIQDQRGTMVNARVVSLLTNAVIASNSKFIPHLVTSGLSN